MYLMYTPFSQFSSSLPEKENHFALIMVGLERLELSTSRLSGVRSNHLSYRP